MIRSWIIWALSVFVLLASTGPAAARQWKDHAHPYTFLFGNHIDTHIELKLRKNGDLRGFFYITWLDKDADGITDVDPASGLPIAGHCNKPEHYENGCFAGWLVRAKPCINEVNQCRAMYLYHYHDHPPWLLDPTVDESGNLRGSRLNIVQPGSYTHMHWLTRGTTHTNDDGHSSYFPSSIDEVEAVFGLEPGGINVPDECNVAMAKMLSPGAICPGYFLEIFAIKSFAFKHGGEPIPVIPGIDNKTHLNLLTSYAPEEIPQEVLDALPAHGGEHGGDDSGGSGGGDHTGGGDH